jgi:hypothetical protein
VTSVEQITVPSLASLGLSADRPLAIIDVDEVLGMFMKGFGEFVARRGYEMRVDRFALFQNIYPMGSQTHIDMETGKTLFEAFFREGCGEIEPAPGAIEALNRIARRAEILILSNAPPEAERLRTAWLKRHGLPHPLILNTGPKGPVTAGLVRQSRGPAAFVDDLLPNLDSVADHAPETATFQHVADERLRAYAPRSERHRRIDDWAELGAAIEAALAGSAQR